MDIFFENIIDAIKSGDLAEILKHLPHEKIDIPEPCNPCELHTATEVK